MVRYAVGHTQMIRVKVTRDNIRKSKKRRQWGLTVCALEDKIRKITHKSCRVWNADEICIGAYVYTGASADDEQRIQSYLNSWHRSYTYADDVAPFTVELVRLKDDNK